MVSQSIMEIIVAICVSTYFKKYLLVQVKPIQSVSANLVKIFAIIFILRDPVIATNSGGIG